MAIAMIVGGLAATGFGIYLYFGHPPVWLKALLVGPGYLKFENVYYGIVPGGLGLVALGLGFVIGNRYGGQYGLPAVLELGGLGFIAFAVVLWFWAPRWARPPWMRTDWYDLLPKGPPPPEDDWWTRHGA